MGVLTGGGRVRAGGGGRVLGGMILPQGSEVLAGEEPRWWEGESRNMFTLLMIVNT